MLPCHVAKELKFARDKSIIILMKNEQKEITLREGSNVTNVDAMWQWETVDGLTTFPVMSNEIEQKDFEKTFRKLVREYALCITGEGLTFLQKNRSRLHEMIIPHVKVFARFSPKQKEHVIEEWYGIC